MSGSYIGGSTVLKIYYRPSKKKLSSPVFERIKALNASVLAGTLPIDDYIKICEQLLRTASADHKRHLADKMLISMPSMKETIRKIKKKAKKRIFAGVNNRTANTVQRKLKAVVRTANLSKAGVGLDQVVEDPISGEKLIKLDQRGRVLKKPILVIVK